MGNNGTLCSAWEGYGPPSASSALTWLSQTYTYDGLNRLTHVEDSGGYTRDFGHDAYGNMWISGYTPIAPIGNPPSSLAGYNANNQVTTGGARFDAAGNQIVINGDAMAYDAENRQISAYDSVSEVSETYSYDGAGQRVQKGVSGGASTVYVYDAFGRLAAEYSSGSNSAPCTTCYLTWDQLGSTRLVTDQNANVVSWHDYLPFGEEIQANTVGRNGTWGSNADATQKFTGQYRDGETNEDYFGARYYRAALGRFTSPDPGNAGADPMNPQSWNGYSYVWNNPLAMIDPSGLDAFDGEDDCLDDPLCGWPVSWPPPIWGYPSPAPTPPPPATTESQQTGQLPSGALPPGSWPGGETLGLPPGMTVPGPFGFPQDCDFGPCGILPTLTPQQSAQVNVALTGFAADFWRGIKIWINGRGASGDPYETRLFGTHWCGPGGAGPAVNNLDRACQVHDYCYDSHNLSVTSNLNLGLSPSQRSALQRCNQALCDASRSVFGRNDGGKYVNFYFSHVLEGTCH